MQKQAPKENKPNPGQNNQDNKNNSHSRERKGKRIVKKGDKKKQPSFWSNLLTIFFILLTITALYSVIVEDKEKDDQISISTLAQNIKEGKVSKIVIEGQKLEITLHGENEGEPEIQKQSKKEGESSLTDTFNNYGVSPEQLNGVEIEVSSPTGLIFWFTALAPFLLPIFFIVILIWYFSRQVKGGGGMQAFTFGQSKAKIIDPKDPKQKVTFKDVAGAKEAKEELIEIVDFLKNPKKFLDIGATIPKGVLLMGAPGTGKTLLARAVAGEAGVNFFSISGSEFVEMFVGVGASRVRDLFKLAKQASPSIIFIDEIDAVGRSRGVGVGGGNDEREQTLNQILVEMDGFEQSHKVIVMAATNRPDVLDPAILRPGRFDRRVTIDLPDREDRKEILKIHARKKPLAEDVNFMVIAQRTPGFSGADLMSLMNEAAILAAREDRKKVGQFDMIRSIEKVMLGPERRSHLIVGKERKITAYHEAGHALVASILTHSDPVHKISIISRGNAGGYTMKIPEVEKRLHSKKEFLDDIAMTFGGYVTEQEVFGDITTGPAGDIQMATNLARNMVTRYGMSDTLGSVALSNDGGSLPGTESQNKNYSSKVAADIDSEIRSIIEEGKERAREIVIKHRSVLDAIAEKLLEVETLERDEYEKVLIANGIAVKKRENLSISSGQDPKPSDSNPSKKDDQVGQEEKDQNK